MPNYLTHEHFGVRVQEALSPYLKEVTQADSLAFRCGLYGPDPLLFFPGGLSLSRLLHATWEERSVPRLQKLLQEGNLCQQSFAAGYLCHMVLDDACHPYIYAMMREQGLSHHIMETGLDWEILRQTGESSEPSKVMKGRARVANMIGDIIGRPKEYQVGLSSMAMLTTQMQKCTGIYRRRLNSSYDAPVKELFAKMEGAVTEAVNLVEDLASTPRLAFA